MMRQRRRKKREGANQKLTVLTDFSRESCRVCSHTSCCKLEPAMLTNEDVKRIQKRTKLEIEDFSRKRNIDGQKIRFLRRKKDGSCFFLDSENKCSIYKDRPVDCRIFPLDIDVQDGIYKWIYYDLMSVDNPCGDKSLSREYYMQMALEAEKSLLPKLEKLLEPYANMDMKLYSSGNWIELQPVKNKLGTKC